MGGAKTRSFRAGRMLITCCGYRSGCGDHLGERVTQDVEALRVFDGSVVAAFDVKCVDGDAALGADACESGIEAVVGDGFSEAIKEANLVAGLDFHDGTFHGEFVVNLDGGRKGTVERFAVGGG